MSRRSERLQAAAFTRDSVERYLQAVAEESARIELAIAEALQRRDIAQSTTDYLDALAHGADSPHRMMTPAAVDE